MRSNRTLKYFKIFVKRTPDLSGKEVEILLARIGRKTHREIGKLYNVTEGRIRQIEKEALHKIRSKAKQLTLFTRMLPKKGGD